MKVLRFRGAKINAHINLDIVFKDDLSFITGINGSGKTTALNCIISLLMPKLEYLTIQPYEYISLYLENEGQRFTLSSRRTKSGASISVDIIPDMPLDVFSVELDDSVPPSRNREMEQTFFREQMARNANHPVLKFIQKLPTPMFLGLDRRAMYQDETLQRYPNGNYSYNGVRRRNVFSQSLSQSLSEALGFALETHRNAQRMKLRFDDKFRQDLVLDLIEFTPSNFTGVLALPTSDDFAKIEAAKKNLQRLPELLGVSEDDVFAKIAPLFDFFDETRKNISGSKRKNKEHRTEAEMSANILWGLNKTHLSKISTISDRISKYNQQVVRLFRETDNFISALSLFFSDSGKKVRFDNFGDLVFSTSGDKSDHDLRALSSGEVQLIVILAHLHFNPEVKKASVFIIDEPELSLHVEWQEKFVDAVLSSSKNTQLIMATHSPSIILDKLDNCIDITPSELT
ncbi:MAG: hypothetical protein JWS10_81 [Cypionkella sp.]|uniref:AAA family ATPase n=1 Tax=Cypionkella sp. TaxID=2811411 RepID=UPI00262D092D|nr:AAA family ATPase [Cypionkella sp.]MDB5657466.1 hypothetical protein [Cypionkella sp.]